MVGHAVCRAVHLPAHDPLGIGPGTAAGCLNVAQVAGGPVQLGSNRAPAGHGPIVAHYGEPMDESA
jgi:hypothetical protein